MRILMLHNYYRIRGGEDISAEAEVILLRNAGHHVDFVTLSNDSIRSQNSWKTAINAIWSFRSYRRVLSILRRDHYDIVHVQNFFPQWSPSVHYAARKAGVPSVQTLHNYRLMCLNGLFFTGGKPCDRCPNSRFLFPGLIRKCYRSSLAGSVSVACMILGHRLLHTWQRRVSAFICLSEFARERFIEAGLPARRIHIKPHFVEPSATPKPLAERKGFVYAGRLSEEKGVETLLKAWKTSNPLREPLWLAGDGPLRAKAVEQAKSDPSLHVVGQQSTGEVHQLIADAKALLYPTECFETFGRTVVEAFAHATPVIVSDFGAAAELVKDQETGIKVKPGDAAGWANAMASYQQSGKMLQKLSGQAFRAYEKHFTPEENLKSLLEIYNQATFD